MHFPAIRTVPESDARRLHGLELELGFLTNNFHSDEWLSLSYL